MSSPLELNKQTSLKINPNTENQQPQNQLNQKSRKSLYSSNKTFQRKEITKPTTKKTLKRKREKLQTQCQGRTSVKLSRSDLKIHSNNSRYLYFDKTPKIECISPSIVDEGYDCLSPNSPASMMNSFAIHRLVDSAESLKSPKKS